ncbi:MAG: hypothetical protein HY906_12810 [Deltaproteobacteria bacterium]|nr:hypothetical protein [Deltaproteobacteria bacterium]
MSDAEAPPPATPTDPANAPEPARAPEPADAPEPASAPDLADALAVVDALPVIDAAAGSRPEARLGLPGDIESQAGAVRPGRAARPGRLLLGVATLGLMALGVWVLATQTDLWASGYRGRRRAEIRQQRDEARARARAGEPRYGTLRVSGAPAGAAVYVALGHTPLAAPHLDTGQSHRLLLDAQGYVPRRLTVPPSAWRVPPADAGLVAPDTEVAEAEATLVAGQVVLTDDEDFAGTGAGSGRTGTLRLRSTPPGASAWLLVGYTPVARIEDLRLDRSYDLMVHKGGYLPARATVSGAAFREGPAGVEHEVTVELREPAAAPRAKR